MGRAPCCDKANVKRGPWAPEEDSKLKSYIETHGTGGNWIALPQKIGLKRCGKSCRLRWLNYLRPNIKHGGFTEDEDNLICSLYISIGSRWSIIAAQLPGRTDNDIKNYWNTRLKKKLFGRQRSREQPKKSERTKKIGYGPINECFTMVYPQPPLMEPLPPLLLPLPPYTGLETSTCDSVIGIPTIPQNYHPQLPNKFENYSYTSSDHTFLPKPFNYTDFHHLPSVNDFRQMEENIRIPHCLNNSEPNNFSAASEMYMAWGDVNCLICPSPSERKMAQEWTYYDEPRLLEY